MVEYFKEFDHSEGNVDVKVNVLRKHIINRFHNSKPPSRILITLSLIKDGILKLHDQNLEGSQDDAYSIRKNVLYMLSFENLWKKIQMLMIMTMMKANKKLIVIYLI